MEYNPLVHKVRTPIETVNIAGAGGLEFGTLTECWGGPKCLAGDTAIYVQNESGEIEIVKIQDMEENVEYQVLTYDKDLRSADIKPAMLSGAHESKDLVEVRLSTGGAIRCTTDHQWLTISEHYLQAKDLLRSDILMSHDVDIQMTSKNTIIALNSLFSENYQDVQVESVVKVDRPEMVYDLEVAGTNNFLIHVGGTYGVFVHNSGKSTFCYQTATNFLEDYGDDALVLIVDSEKSASPLRLSKVFGLRPCNSSYKTSEEPDPRVFVVPGMTLEAAAGHINKYIKKARDEKKKLLVIWDSISASMPAKEYSDIQESIKSGKDANMYSGGMMLRARVLGFLMNSIMCTMEDTPVCVLLINQARTQIGRFTSSEGSGGGYQFKHNIHYSLYFKFKKKTGEVGVFRKGTQSSLTVTKTKLMPSISEISLFIMDDKGGVFDTDQEVINVAYSAGLFEGGGRGGWYQLSSDVIKHLGEDHPSNKSQRFDDFTKDSEVIAALRETIKASFRSSYMLVDESYKEIDLLKGQDSEES